MKAWRRKTKRWLRPRRLNLTREGKYFVAVSVGIGLAAINTGNNLLYLLLGWTLSMIVASGILSESTLRKLRVSRRPPFRLYANTPFVMEVSVENPSKRIASYSVEISDLVAETPIDKRCYFLKIPAGEKQTTCYEHTFKTRGEVVIDGTRIATRFPFGLFSKSRDTEGPCRLLVLPEVRNIQLPAPRAQQTGEIASGRAGRRGEFFGLRDYTEHDDMRSIHWRSSAKAGRMVVREFEEEAKRRATIAIESGFPNKPTEEDRAIFEESVSLAASLFVAYENQGYETRFVSRDTRTKFGSGSKHLYKILSDLAVIEPIQTSAPLEIGQNKNSEGVLITSAQQSQMGIIGSVHHSMRANP